MTDIDGEWATALAVTGMALRLPNVSSIDEFWRATHRGTDLVTRGPYEQPARRGEPVHAVGVLDGVRLFDADFFGISGAEARTLDPQHRLLLTVGWEAIVDAGLESGGVRTGVFAGVSPPTYLLSNLLGSDPRGLTTGMQLGNDKDFAATRIAYRLGLTGPAFTVQSACSTGLAALQVASRALLAGDCDAALVATASIQFPQQDHYLFDPAGMLSPTGRCRPFDAEADGCTPADGVVAFVVRRLEDGIRDGDQIDAVIQAVSANNDGAQKLGYAAPSLTGQVAVIRDALSAAGLEPNAVGYVESHGTGTVLGDPAELGALGRVFGTVEHGVRVGSLKGSVGHLDVSAGSAGLLRAVLAVRGGVIPPTVGHRVLSPAAAAVAGRMTVPTSAEHWPLSGARVAGVSSLGIGGTNVHAIVRSWDHAERSPVDGPVVMPLSNVRSAELQADAMKLAHTLDHTTSLDLELVAATLSTRVDRAERCIVQAATIEEAITRLKRITVDVRATGFEVVPPAWQAWLNGQGEKPPPPAARRARLAPPSLRPVEHWTAGPDVSSQDPGPRRVSADLAPRQTDDSSVVDVLVPTWSTHHLTRGAARIDDAWHLVSWGEPTEDTVTIREAMPVRCSHQWLTPLASLAATSDFESGLEDASGNVLVDLRGLLSADVDDRTALASILGLGKALVRRHLQGEHVRRVVVLTTSRYDVSGGELVDHRAAFASGLGCLEDELAGLSLRTIDIRSDVASPVVVQAILEGDEAPRVVALRGRRAWRLGWEAVTDDSASEQSPALPGPLLVLGGTGGIGGHLARQFARPGLDVGVIVRQAPETRLALPWPQDPPSHLDVGDREAQDGHRQELRSALIAVSQAEVWNYWTHLGVTEGPQAVSGELLRERSEASAALAPLLDAQLDIMCLEDGPLQPTGSGGFSWTGRHPQEVTVARERVLDIDPGYQGLLDLLNRAASSWTWSLQAENGAAVLFPGGETDELEGSARVMMDRSTGRLACSAFADFLVRRAREADGPLRVLEVGAGNGLLTDLLLDAVTDAGIGHRVEYCVTDIGRRFVQQAANRERRLGSPDVQYRVLDISRDPTPQGLERESFDVVVGLNVVHATPDTAHTLTMLRHLLAVGGVLSLIESVGTEPWVDLVAGLAPGWWCATDDRSGRTPLRDAQDWVRQLESTGYEHPAVFPGDVDADCIVITAAAAAADHRTTVTSLVRDLEASGAVVHELAADLRDHAAVSAAVAGFSEAAGPVATVLHAAGRVSGATFTSLDDHDLDVEYEVRLGALLNVLEVCSESLERVVLSSSETVLEAGIGQGAYVAVNAALASLPDTPRLATIPATSVLWGRWHATGLGASFVRTLAALGHSSAGAEMQPADAIRGLEQVLRYQEPVAVVRASDTGVGDKVVAPATGSRESGSDPEARERVIAFCRRTLALANLQEDDRLLEAGADSLDALELQASLAHTYGVDISTAVLVSAPLHDIVDACLELGTASDWDAGQHAQRTETGRP